MTDQLWDAALVASVLVGTGVAWWLVRLLTRPSRPKETERPEGEPTIEDRRKERDRRRDLETRRQLLETRHQLLLVGVILIGTVAVVIALPIGGDVKGALLGAFGVTVAAVVGLSSTTIVGNVFGGLMLQSVANFRVNDWIQVEDHFGKVTHRRLLTTEIQTEDRDLMTLPNLFLATNPVRVVRESGTIVSASVSIGYDVHHLRLEPIFALAAADAGLRDPIYTYVTELGDHAVTYRVSGLLEPVDYLLSVRSGLRSGIFDRLGDAGIEIVSPGFMNRRELDAEQPIVARRPMDARPTDERPKPEDKVLDKAMEAGAAEELREQQATAQAKLAELEALRKSADEQQTAAIDGDIVIIEERIADVTAKLQAIESTDEP